MQKLNASALPVSVREGIRDILHGYVLPVSCRMITARSIPPLPDSNINHEIGRALDRFSLHFHEFLSC